MKTAFIIRYSSSCMHAEEAAAKLARQIKDQRREDYPILVVPSNIYLEVYEPGHQDDQDHACSHPFADDPDDD